MPNRNLLAASILADELARAGVQSVCLAPGSRNTPLVLAFARHGGLQVSSHLDERSAAFFALGQGLASGRPSVVVCTSGSAAANFFPAIVEARQAGVPLLVLTADRPHELRHSGANQTIDQMNMFGGFALWSVDLPLPEAQPSALLIRSLRTLVGRAVALATQGGGVVHLNLPFRPPLEPNPVAGDLSEPPQGATPRSHGRPFTSFAAGAGVPAEAVAALAELIGRYRRGLIVCGPRCPHEPFGTLVAELARRSGYPALSDGSSGLRLSQPTLLGGYDSFLAGKVPFAPPEVIVRFGAVPTSKWLNQYLDSAAVQEVVHVRADGVWADDSHRVSQFVQADEAGFIRALLARLETPVGDTGWLRGWLAAEELTWRTIDAGFDAGPFFDAVAVADTTRLLPSGAALFVGNSLPVRHLDQFARPSDTGVAVFASRGASGIDGNLSTALGIGSARPSAALAAIVGDITFYHDMNGLLAVRRCGVPITIVLLHNDGGGIFQRLPVREFEPEFNDFFVTPHGLDFAHAARLYGLDYVQAANRAAFQTAFRDSIERRNASIIEVRSDARADLARRQEIISALHAQLGNLSF